MRRGLLYIYREVTLNTLRIIIESTAFFCAHIPIFKVRTEYPKSRQVSRKSRIKIQKMKKILLSFTAILLGFTLSAGTVDAPATTFAQEINYQNYCPDGYICVATNMTAKGYDRASGKDITGIAVYKKEGNYIAYVPNHGHLHLTWGTGGETGWHFYANGGVYVIQKLGRNI